MLDGINHVAINCLNNKLDESKIFYSELLGFDITSELHRPERNSTIVYLDAGNIQIELCSFEELPVRPSYPEAQGLRHLAFSTKDFDKTVKELNDKGIKTTDTQIDAITGNRHCYFFDPSNQPLELCETK